MANVASVDNNSVDKSSEQESNLVKQGPDKVQRDSGYGHGDGAGHESNDLSSADAAGCIEGENSQDVTAKHNSFRDSGVVEEGGDGTGDEPQKPKSNFGGYNTVTHRYVSRRAFSSVSIKKRLSKVPRTGRAVCGPRGVSESEKEAREETVTHRALCPADFDGYLDTLYQKEIINKKNYNCIREERLLHDKVKKLTHVLAKGDGRLDLENADLLEHYRQLASKDYVGPVRHNLTQIVQDLQVTYVLDHLLQEDAISSPAYHVIMAEPTMQGKARRLLSELPPTDTVYAKFKESLRDPYPHLFELLQTAERAIKPEYQPGSQKTSGSAVKYTMARGGNSKMLRVVVEVVHSDSDSDSCDEEATVKEVEEYIVNGRLRLTRDDRLDKIYSIEIRDLKIGCILLFLNVKNKPGLQKFYKDSQTGELDKLLQELLIDENVKKIAKGRDIRVRVTISQEEYDKLCKEFDTENDSHSSEDDDVSDDVQSVEHDSHQETESTSHKMHVDVPVPVLFPGFQPVESVDVINLTSNSVRVKWSMPESISNNSGYRVTCLRTGGKKILPPICHVIESPSIKSWERGCLPRGEYRISVSVMYWNEDETQAIYSPAKWVNVTIGHSKRQVISRVYQSESRSVQRRSVARLSTVITEGGHGISDDKKVSKNHHAVSTSEGGNLSEVHGVIDPGCSHHCKGDSDDSEKAVATSLSAPQSTDKAATRCRDRPTSVYGRRLSVSRTNSVRVRSRPRANAVSAWAKPKRSLRQPVMENGMECPSTDLSPPKQTNIANDNKEEEDLYLENVPETDLYIQVDLERKAVNTFPMRASSRDSGIFDQCASDDEQDTYL